MSHDRPFAPAAPAAGAALAAPSAAPTDLTPALLAAFAQLDEGVIVADAHGRIAYVNDAAARLHGGARLDVAPDEYADAYRLLTEDGAPYPSTELPLARAVLRGETVVDARWRIRRPDGTEVLAVGTARPVVGPDGRRAGAVLTVRDDTARGEAERAQRERDLLAGQLREVFVQSPVSTILYDAGGRPVGVNAAFERLWGARLSDVPAEYSVLADPQLEAAGVLPLLRRAFGLDGARTGDGAGEPVTLPAIRYDVAHTVGRGEVRWTQAHAYPVRDAAGAVERVVLKHEDVTERYAAEAALREANAELAERNAALEEQGLELELANQQLQDQAAELEAQTEELQATAAALEARTADAEAARRATADVLEGMADAYFALDDQFRIVAVNAAMERGTGLTRAELLGRGLWEAFPGALGTAFETHYRAAGRGEEAHFTHDYSDGRLALVVDVDAYPAAGGGVAVFWRDVTARVRAEAALRASEAKYRALFESMDQGFCVVEVLADDRGRPADYRFLEANPAFVGQTGLAGAIGRTAREAVPGLEQHWVDVYGRVALTGEPTRFRQGSEAMGRWFDVYAFRVGEPAERRVAILFTDVSAAVAAERERERLLAAEGSARAASERAAARTARLQALTAALANTRTVDDVAAVIVAEGVEATGAATGMLAVRTPGTAEAAIVRHTGLAPGVLAAYARFPFAGPDAKPGPAAEALRTGAAVFAESRGGPGGLLARFPEIPEVWDQLGAQALATVPLAAAGETVGAMSFTFAAPRAFDADDRAFFLALGRQAAQAVERARLFEAERAARVEAERQRREAEAAEARLRDVFEQAPVAVAVLSGPDHVYTVVSPLYAQSPGAGRPLLGRTVREAFPEIAGTGYYEVMDRVYATGEPFFAAERQVFLDRPGGGREEHFFNVGYQPLRDAAGRVYALASVAYDVTAQVRARREIEAARGDAERARQAAEAANQAKGQFLANMSHELRTPLNAIGGYAQLLDMGLHGPVTGEQREALGRVQRAQQHLLGLINDVLNYAKLESGRVEYDVRPVRVADVVTDVRPLVEPQLAAKGLAFAVALPEDAGAPPVAVHADREKLGQVLLNLLSNAVKFTEPGGRVEVALEAPAPGAAGPAVARVHVRDTGRGVPADKLAAIFEPFVQVGKRYAGEAPGTGLGLAISRDLARGMGGDLTAESAPGAGSTFTVTLPLA